MHNQNRLASGVDRGSQHAVMGSSTDGIPLQRHDGSERNLRAKFTGELTVSFRGAVPPSTHERVGGRWHPAEPWAAAAAQPQPAAHPSASPDVGEQPRHSTVPIHAAGLFDAIDECHQHRCLGCDLNPPSSVLLSSPRGSALLEDRRVRVPATRDRHAASREPHASTEVVRLLQARPAHRRCGRSMGSLLHRRGRRGRPR